MLDKTIPYRSLYMARPAGLALPDAPALPQGFSLRAFSPGDDAHWARIETSVGEFPDEGAARAYFAEHFAPHPELLAQRCRFAVNPEGLPVATATAWEQDGVRVLHWVACCPGFQRRGLGRAVVLAALSCYPNAASQPVWLHTQTWSHRAILLYHALGFALVRRGALPGRTDNEYDAGVEVLRTVLPPDVLARLTHPESPQVVELAPVELASAQRTPPCVEALTALWERSVRATHDFLTEPEIRRLRSLVPQALAGVPRLFAVQAADGAPLGFMGVDGPRLEMLFLDPAARGQGLGRALLQHALTHCSVRELTVNEQNPQARGFYEHMGFAVNRRTDTDEQGAPYPLLYMVYQDANVP